MKTLSPLLAAGAALMLAAVAVRAEFSPLSSQPDGFGVPVAPMGARERAMGEGGLSAVANKGFFLPNVSRSAFFEKTAFIATLEGDADLLRDHDRSSRIGSGGFSNLAMIFRTKSFGTVGAYYQQTQKRTFEAYQPLNGNYPEQRYLAEGGMFVLGLSYAYSPFTWLALGVSENYVLGRDRYIQSADFTGIAPPEAIALEGDTLEVTHEGSYPTVSATVRTRRFDFAVSYTHSADLETHTERHTSNVLSDSLPSTDGTDLPRVYAVGASWKPNRRQTLAADFNYEAWTDAGALNPAWQASLGYEVRGSDNPFDNLLERTTWRAGGGYKVLYLEEVPELFATVGAGMPLGPRGHVLDFSLKYGHRSHDGITFFSEDYVKLSASIVGVSVWGQPARKRR
jgi:long-chain fatty acid transport protein